MTPLHFSVSSLVMQNTMQNHITPSSRTADWQCTWWKSMTRVNFAACILAVCWTQKRTAGQRKADMDVYIHIKTGVKILKKTFLQKSVTVVTIVWTGGMSILWFVLSQLLLGAALYYSCLDHLHVFCTHEWCLCEIWNGCKETKPWRGKI